MLEYLFLDKRCLDGVCFSFKYSRGHVLLPVVTTSGWWASTTSTTTTTTTMKASLSPGIVSSGVAATGGTERKRERARAQLPFSRNAKPNLLFRSIYVHVHAYIFFLSPSLYRLFYEPLHVHFIYFFFSSPTNALTPERKVTSSLFMIMRDNCLHIASY